MRKLLLLFSCFITTSACAETHNPKPFGLWASEFQAEAKSQGISDALLTRAFEGMTPNDRVVELDRRQPESTKTFTEYLQGAVSQTRINKGREMMREHQALLEKTAAQYGVQPRFIVALWGIETNFGGYTGNFSVVRSLATLAYDGRRGEFFRKELLNALKIIDAGHIGLNEMEGSWAGAMGQCQFMPSSFLAYAVDGNGDGRKDIWGTLPDVFASIANYLKQSGWNDELTWGRQVRLPDSFSGNLLTQYTDNKTYLSLAEWQKLGISTADGSALPERDISARLMLPGERYEAAYLVYRNADVLMKWNRSQYFVTAVGTLSDAIR